MPVPKTVAALKIVLWVIAMGLLAYLALRGSPSFSELGWMPRWLARWSDANGVLRNLPAFALLYLFTLLVCGLRRCWWACGVSCLLALLLESAQLFLPHRSFDVDDIAVSIAGVLGVHLPVCLWLWVRSRPRRAKPVPVS